MSADYGGPLSGHGISLISLPDDHPVSDAVLDGAIDKWAGKNGCSDEIQLQLRCSTAANGDRREVWDSKRPRAWELVD